MYSCNHMYCTNCNKKTKETCLICNEKKELISFDNNPDDHTLVYEYHNRVNRVNTLIDRQNILNTILYPINDIGANNLYFPLTSTPIRTTPIIFTPVISPLRTPITYREVTSTPINTPINTSIIDPTTLIVFR